MAKKKKKSKLKKLAKLLGAGVAIAGLGRAFANRNATPSTNADAIKAMTSNAAYSDNTMPGNLSKNMGMKPRRRDSILAKPGINKMDLSEVDFNYTAPSMDQYRNMNMGLEGYYKKGDRVGVGKAKRGFGRAMKKGGKK